MAHFTTLPVEIIDHIVSFIPSTQQKSLSNLSRTCKPLYNSVIPTLYRCLRIHFAGHGSWDSRIEILKELAPPGSYTLSGHDNSSLAGKSREDVAGTRFSTSQCFAESSAPTTQRKWPINFIREIVVDGYWSYPAEQGDSYFSWNDEFEPIHEQFSRALNGLLCSLDRLDSFTWKIVNTISPAVALTLSRFDSLKTLDIVCDTHMVAGSVSLNGSVPTLVMVDPSSLYYNSLKTLRLLQIGDQNHAVLFGDIMRSPTNWKSLRHIETDLSLGFMKALMEMDPVVPDILFALFRPPPPARGSLESPKLALESLQLKDIPFQNAGLDALVASVDPAKLKRIDFCFCQSSGNLFKRWEKTPLPSLERLVLRDGVTLSTLSKFLKQFGPEGTCRKLKSLELNCKGLPSLRAVEQGVLEFYDINLYDYPGDTDSDDSFDDEDEFVDDFFDAHGIIAPESPDAATKTKTSKDSLPAPWKAIQDLRGCMEEGWGIERLVLDIIPSMRIYDAASLPKQDVFFEGFWSLRELVVPVSYDENLWNPFVETIGKLPNLTHLCLVNNRPEPRHAGTHFNPLHPIFNTHHYAYHMPTLFPYHLHLSGGSGSGRSSRSKKRGKKSAVKEEPDQAYIDALSIAAANRLHVHSNGMSGSEALASLASPGSSASQQAVVDSWSGKLQYIGIRPATTTIGRPQARTWRVVVQKTKPPKKAPKPEVETERRKSLRSSTKRRKVDDEGPKDWRVVKEGEWECRLSQVVSLELEGLAGGLFDKHGRGEWRTTW